MTARSHSEVARCQGERMRHCDHKLAG
jgi:hypothetical protein